MLGVGRSDYLDELASRLDEREDLALTTSAGMDDAIATVSAEDGGPVDCVVSDLTLVDGDGIELLERLREHDADLPFVLFTADGSEQAASRAIGAGVTDYMRRADDPEQWDVLVNRIRNYVERHRLEREDELSEVYRLRLYEVTSDPELTPREKIRRILRLGRERLGVNNAMLSYIRPDQGIYEVAEAVGPGVEDVQGEELRLDEVYCKAVYDSDEILGWRNLGEGGWKGDRAHETFDWGCYLGSRLEVHGELFGTVCFGDMQPRDRDFSHPEKAFVDAIGRWGSYELQEKQTDQWIETWRDMVDGS